MTKPGDLGERPMIGRPFWRVYRSALILAIWALVGADAWRPAAAADLGGNCCADLEGRMAELEATAVRRGSRRVSLTLSGQVVRSILYWNDEFQSDIYSVDNVLNTSRFRFVGSAGIYQELQAGFMMELDLRLGARSNQINQFDDDGISGSGGILGGAALGDGIGGAGDSVIGIRIANWWLESKHLGKLTLGRLNTGTGDISTIDLSGSSVITSSEPGNWNDFFMRNALGAAGGATWSTQCGGPSAAGPYSSDCFEQGPSRRDAARYDTPTWHGFGVSAAFGEDDFWDVALRYSGEWHGFRVAAGIGYRRYEDREPDVVVFGPPDRKLRDTDRRHWLTSASAMHVASGLFLNGAYTRYEFHGTNANEVIGGVVANGNRPNIPMWWVSGGIQRNWFVPGNTTFYGEYGWFEDGTAGLLAATAYPKLGPLGGGTFTAGSIVTNSQVAWWGFGAVQTIDAAAIDLYIGYRAYQADAAISGGPTNQIPGGLQDIRFIQAGARILF